MTGERARPKVTSEEAPAAAPPGSRDAQALHPVLELQRTIGNRATVDHLAEGQARPGAAAGAVQRTVQGLQPDLKDRADLVGGQAAKANAASAPKTMTPLPPPKKAGELDDPKAEARLQALAKSKAKEVIGAVEPLERNITAELKKIAAANGGQMVGLRYATKEVTSLHRKLADEARKRVIKGEVISRAVALEAENTKDALRYTMMLPSDKYAEVADTQLVNALAALKATRIKAANAWAPPSAGTPHSYKGFNSAYTIEASKGIVVKFEVQLHTSESWAMKSELHGLYETARDEKASAADRANANEQMAEAWKKVPVPAGIEAYDKDMKKKG